jgi:hypothetical protein
MIKRPCWIPVFLVACAGLLGCDRYVNTPQCSDLLRDTPFPAHMQTDTKGSVLDKESGLRWYRCSAGQRFSNGQCVGDALQLSQAEAMAYAEEFSRRANQAWRVPSVSDMQTLSLSGCLNPILHTEVFPGILVENYWTSSASATMPGMGCIFYTFNGNSHCRHARSETKPFLLVLGQR